MIKAAAKDLVLLGLSRRNCEKLLEGKPIFITPESLGGHLKQAVLILAGENEAAILKELQAHPDVFDLSKAQISVVPPGGEDAVQVGADVYDMATGEKLAPPPPQAPRRGPLEASDEIRAEATRLANLLSREVEVPGSGWRFALFLYRDAQEGEQAGHVVQVSRDRERTKEAVARWLRDLLEAQKATARG